MKPRGDWRTERDRALLVLESAKKASLRAEAAEALCLLAREGPDRADDLAPLVAGLLADRQLEVRRAGLALGALVSPIDDLEGIFSRGLLDPSALVRVEAAGRLADLARPSARAALAAALADESFPVRFEAARGMATLKHSAGVEVLQAALEENDFRYRALGAIAELGDPRALPAVRKVFARWLLPAFERTQAAGAMARLGDEAGEVHLFSRTRGKWAVDRAMAVELLGEVKAKGAYERLQELAMDSAEVARGAALRGLGRLGDPRAEEVLRTVLREPGAPDDLRLDAAEGLLQLSAEGSREAVEGARALLGAVEAREELDTLLEETAR